MIKANYHTHTARCGHALGTDEAYVRAAISQGFDVLGFSDHMPWPYASGFVNQTVRMTVNMMPDYLRSLRALKETYAGQIEIFAGFECEYFPQYMNWLAETKEAQGLDYLILGNHFEPTDETGGVYYGRCRTASQLRSYTDSAIKGLETGLFAYIAHPDLFMRSYPVFDDNCRAAARELAQACRAMNIPMEYNLHSRYCGEWLTRTRYPHPVFFEIARDEGVQVIIGVDAHEPEEIANPAQWDWAVQSLSRMEMSRIGQLEL